MYFALSGLNAFWATHDPGATRLALLGACPWLLYFAPLALRREGAFFCGAPKSRSRHGFGWGSDLRPDPMNRQPEEEAYDIRHDDSRKVEPTDADADQDRNEQ